MNEHATPEAGDKRARGGRTVPEDTSMSGSAGEQRIAQLKARAQAQRLAAQLAILEAREQLSPLRAVAGVVGAAARALSPGGAAGGMVGALAKFGIGHPLLVSALAAAALRLIRRRPIAALVAAGCGAAAWWLLRSTAQPSRRQEQPA